MFKIMTSVLDKNKHRTIEEINKIPSYIFCRWLSGSPYAVAAANQINMYDKIPIENQFNLIRNVFGGKIKYIPYPKNVSEKQVNDVNVIAGHFKINTLLAQEYIELMNDKEFKEIIEMYNE